MKAAELWNWYLQINDGDVNAAIEMMASDLVATSEHANALARTGYFRAGQPSRPVIPPKTRPAPLDVSKEQAVDL